VCKGCCFLLLFSLLHALLGGLFQFFWSVVVVFGFIKFLFIQKRKQRDIKIMRTSTSINVDKLTRF
jgi:hypothetical protein